MKYFTEKLSWIKANWRTLLVVLLIILVLIWLAKKLISMLLDKD